MTKVLITGGTGSFGTTMIRHLLQGDTEEIRIFSRDEAKQDQLRHQYPDKRINWVIGDTRNPESIDWAMRDINRVFQAAALKQVPSCERFPMEAVATNINGSANVIKAAINHYVESVVCLSTDKAVHPINAMGMSKALMEKTALAMGQEATDTTISVTRYGNVMASRGSVIPLFIRQLKAGKPITVTDPEMTRFLMSLTESVQLVEHAWANAQPGDLFVHKAKATTIANLASALGIILNKPVEIEVIGYRPGEKKHETLLSAEDYSRAEDAGQFYRVPAWVPAQQPIGDFSSNTHPPLTPEQVAHLLVQVPEVVNELV